MVIYSKMNTIKKGNNLSEFTKDYTAIDLETTGFKPVDNEITEIGAVKVRDFKTIDKYNTFIKIKSYIPPIVERKTGISKQMLEEEGVDIEVALSELKDFIGKDIIVGHNVNFDMNFLCYNFTLVKGIHFTNDYIDTLAFSKELIKGLKNYKLKTIIDELQIKHDNLHRALDDALITNELYKKLYAIKEKSRT